jgi:hypothetical protein
MPLLADEESTADSPSFDPAELAAEIGNSEEYDAEFGELFVRDLPDGSAEEVTEAWTPLASLIQKCKHLTDLVWVCRNQLPPCLLEAIHQHHPACRLHLRSFRLRSLRDPVTDPHELDLIRSPCLHSISVKTVGIDSDGNLDYNRSAIFQVVALAPNLSHLNTIIPGVASSPALYHAHNSHRPWVPWKGFVPPLEIVKRGALTSLSYFRRGMSVEDIQEWPKYANMSKIRYLILGDVSDPLVFRFLTQNINFASLELLDFGLSPTTMDNRGLLVSESESLIEQLEPLTAFRFSGYLAPSVLDKILQRHGPKMRRLTLNPNVTEGARRIGSPISAIRLDEIRRVESYCPLLEYLSISIPNTGDLEYGISDVCPKLRHLRELELKLELDIHLGLSDLLIEKAARKIWDLIDKEKGGCRLNCLHIVGPNVSLYF